MNNMEGGFDYTISRILIFPVEFAATKVDDWPRQHTDEMNCAASSISWPESGSMVLNLYDNAGMGNALWYMNTCSIKNHHYVNQI